MSGFVAPDPLILAAITFEDLRQQRIAAFLEQWELFRARFPDLPAYTVETLQSDSAIAALRAAATGDMHFRALLNSVGRATILTGFARGADLDLHGLATRTPGFPDGVIRHPGELDEPYAARIVEARAGSSAAGPDAWWLSNIRAAHAGVAAATLTYLGQGRLTVAVAIAEDADGAEVLEAVRARLARGWVRPQGVTVTVVAA